MSSNSMVNVGPTSENLAYGDSMSTSRHLSPLQFPVKLDIHTPTEDNGFIGPLGSYGNILPGGSLYGYGANTGVSSGYPQY